MWKVFVRASGDWDGSLMVGVCLEETGGWEADKASPMLEMGSTVAYVRRRRGERVDGRVEAKRRDVVVRRAAIADGGEDGCGVREGL